LKAKIVRGAHDDDDLVQCEVLIAILCLRSDVLRAGGGRRSRELHLKFLAPGQEHRQQT
jgi:hypothetical protein